MPLIPALERQRQTDLCEFKASLVYRVSSRTGSKPREKKRKKNKTLIGSWRDGSVLVKCT